MDLWNLLLPIVLVLARVGAFIMVLPLFGWHMLPMMIRAGLAMVLTVSYALQGAGGHPAGAGLLEAGTSLVQEILCGLGLGLAANLVYLAVQQMGKIVTQLMGLADAGILDPVSGEEADVMEMLFDMIFALLFLAAGGHHVLLALIDRSYDAFPTGTMPAIPKMVELLLLSASDMLVFALKLAAPLMAAFLVLNVALAVLSRAMPEANVMFLSFPVRIGLGVWLAIALVPSLGLFTADLTQWFGRHLGL